LTKPVNAGYGSGIRRLTSFIEAREYIQSRLQYGTKFLAQEEILGKDIDCSMLCKDGEILAATVQRPVFANMREFAAAAAIEFVQDDVVIEVASQIARLLNWTGIAHIDMRYDEKSGQVYVLEINPRFWGSLAGSTRSGVNFPVLSCQVTTGESLPSISARKIRYSSPQTLMKFILQTRPEGQEPLKFSETAFSDMIRDPLPAIAAIVSSKFRFGLSTKSIRQALRVKRMDAK
jgi:predicted ATP-grasp superfamily ATP-dependent carboligase